jgi:hypothetical protein
MTYGYQPENWPMFQDELARRGIESDDIEKVELRPEQVVVTLRSGRVEAWETPKVR